jgi:hypothetical protein
MVFNGFLNIKNPFIGDRVHEKDMFQNTANFYKFMPKLWR